MLFLDSCSSTQIIARNIIDDGFVDDSFFIISKEMTAGITRKPGINWISPPGNLYLSIIQKKLSFEPFLIPAITAFSVYTFLELEYKAEDMFVKWPNDIIIRKKKVCGVLSQLYKNYFIIGIAINLDSYPEETFNFEATSIKKEFGFSDFDIKQIGNNIYLEVLRNFNYFLTNRESFKKKLFDSLSERFYNINSEIKIISNKEDEEAEGIFLGVDSSYNLKLKTRDGLIKTYSSAEILNSKYK